ncbi:hypothetical protein E4U22_007956 [Claviceps purpurea]|nr:hypothetical protein E4U22_007956 [Claviceps purpurea]
MVYSAAHIKHMQHIEVTGLPSQEVSHQPPFSVPSGRPYGPRVRPSERDAQLALWLGKKFGSALVVTAATVAPRAIESGSDFGGQASFWCCQAECCLSLVLVMALIVDAQTWQMKGQYQSDTFEETESRPQSCNYETAAAPSRAFTKTADVYLEEEGNGGKNG